MYKILALIKRALQSDPNYKKCSLTEPIDILFTAYQEDADRFDAMVAGLNEIEDTYKA